MNCKNHQEKCAEYSCNICGKPICSQCIVELHNSVYCKDCLESKLVYPIGASQPVSHNVKKSKFLTFILSFLPGTGHMYLGLINKGISIMIMFFGAIILSMISTFILGIYWLEGFLPFAICTLFIAYSLFDSLAAANDINSGRILKDVEMRNYSYILNALGTNKNIIGYIIISLGFIGILNIFSNNFENVLFRYLKIHLSISNLIFPIVMIIAGFYLIRRGDKKSEI